MHTFSYTDSPYPIRDDIQQAHQEFWRRLASPGAWWTGEERVAIAAAARAAIDCEFCQTRKQALSPYTLEGDHQHNTALPDLVVDAAHRVMTDQNRITKRYVEDNVGQGLSKPAYVELVGIVVALLSIDEFHRALGLPPEPLPTPQDGEISRYTPANLSEDIGFVPTIAADGTPDTPDADLWPANQTANVVRALSLVPDAVRDWRSLGSAQYLSFEGMQNFVQDEARSINRMQMELIAGRVSAVNECFY